MSAFGAVEMSDTLFVPSSIGLPAYKRLTLKDPGASVHSAYRGAINISTRRGLVSLVPHKFGRGPLNVNLSGGALDAMGLRPGDPILIRNRTFSLGHGISVSFDRSQIYDPSGKFLRPVLKESSVGINISTVRKAAIGAGRLDGLGGLLLETQHEAGKISMFAKKALPAIRSLMRALKNRQLAAIQKASTGLVGLGPGLTPSADDMLSGMMVALVLGSLNGCGPRSARTLTSAISDAAEGRTTALSLEFLRQAALGRSNERVTRLVEGIFTGTKLEARNLLFHVLSMGETSGTDMAVGVILGTEFVLKNWSAN